MQIEKNILEHNFKLIINIIFNNKLKILVLILLSNITLTLFYIFNDFTKISNFEMAKNNDADYEIYLPKLNDINGYELFRSIFENFPKDSYLKLQTINLNRYFYKKIAEKIIYSESKIIFELLDRNLHKNFNEKDKKKIIFDFLDFNKYEFVSDGFIITYNKNLFEQNYVKKNKIYREIVEILFREVKKELIHDLKKNNEIAKIQIQSLNSDFNINRIHSHLNTSLNLKKIYDEIRVLVIKESDYILDNSIRFLESKKLNDFIFTEEIQTYDIKTPLHFVVSFVIFVLSIIVLVLLNKLNLIKSFT